MFLENGGEKEENGELQTTGKASSAESVQAGSNSKALHLILS